MLRPYTFRVCMVHVNSLRLQGQAKKLHRVIQHDLLAHLGFHVDLLDYRVKPKNFTALSSMIFLRTSGFMLTCWNSSSQRSTPMAGQSEPNIALSCSNVLMLCTSS